jgi:hypothetical protein
VVSLLIITLGLFTASSPDQAATYGAQPSVDMAFATYLALLRAGVKDPTVGLLSPSTQQWMRARKVTDAQQRAELSAIQVVYATRTIRENGALAVVLFPGSAQVPPYFFRQGTSGWTIDLAIAGRIIGFDRQNRWYVREKASEFSFAFE